MSRLVTASIVGSMRWLQTCPPDWKEKAAVELKNQLARIWMDKGEAIELGVNFERKVYACAEAQRLDAGSKHFKWFVEQCCGGVFQKKVKRFIMLDDVEYCLFGKLDVWFPEHIKDIKTTSNYRGRAKYLSSFQHKLYCYVTECAKFTYLVAEFEEGVKPPVIVAHHEIEYVVDDFKALEVEVLQTVRELVDFLKLKPELFDLYVNKFSYGG